MTKIYLIFCFYLFQFNVNASTLDSLIFIDVDEVLSDLKKNDTLSKYYEYEIYDSITDLDKTSIHKLLNIHLFFDAVTIKEKLEGQRKYPRKHIQFYKIDEVNLKDLILNKALLINVLVEKDFYLHPKIYIKGNKMVLFKIYGGNEHDFWGQEIKILKKRKKLKIYVLSGYIS